jgi:hypothetical protein
MFVAPGAEPSLGIDWSIRSLATFIGVCSSSKARPTR